MKKTYRQDKVSGKFLEVVKTSAAHGTMIQGAFEPFVSHVDGSHITTRSQLAEHNKRHNVTQDTNHERIAARTAERENLYGGQYKDPTRKADIQDAVERCRSEGDNRYRY